MASTTQAPCPQPHGARTVQAGVWDFLTIRDIERFFSGRDWGTRTEAEIHIRQIAKNETRAGVLWRIDLQNQLETGL